MRRASKRRRAHLIAILIAPLLHCAPSLALDTATIVPSVASPSCLEYQVVGACYWLRCTNFGCKIKTSAKVRHYVPDAVVSSYSSTGENPWTEVRTLSGPISQAKGGGSGTTNDQHENNLSIFKNVDVIGHPGIAAFNAFASGSGYTCAGAGKPYVPNMLSTLDYIGWRYGIPESVYPQSLIPGIREIGSRLSLNLWGNVYPRSGFLHQVDDYKASAVMAQRAGDIVTRPGQVHVYQPLLAAPSPGYWPAGELHESDPSTGKWQQLTPQLSNACAVFPRHGLHAQAIDGGYPNLTDSKYLSEIMSLQDQGRLFGTEITGVWVFTSVSDQELKNSTLEYSPQFAELIIAADCGEWHHIDADDMIAKLDAMLIKARARKGP